MIRRPPRCTRTDTLFPYTTLFRSEGFPVAEEEGLVRDHRLDHLADEGRPRVLHQVANEPVDRAAVQAAGDRGEARSEEHTSELQSLMRISYAVFCLKKKTTIKKN